MKRKSISRGGITYGNSHANGGIKVFNKGTGDMLEVEGGESVINKRSMASPKMVKLNGKDMTICEAASYLNQAEGGVKFNCDDVKHAQFIEEMALGGELERGTRTEREHIQVLNDLYARKITPTQATKKIAKDHIKEDKRYYSKLANMKNKMSSGGEITYPKKMYPTADVIFENGNMIDSKNEATVINNRKMTQVPKITLHREYNDNIQGNMQVRSPQDANDAFRYIFSPSEMAVREFAYILYLDRGNKIVAWESHSMGGVDASVIDVELICTSAVLIAAKGVILAHNHPSGNRQPSDADLKISVRLKKALNILSVSLLDSVILLPNGSYVSLENEGLIDADLKYDDGGNIESLDYDFSEKLGVKVDSLVNPVLRLEHFLSFTNHYCDIDPEVCKNVKSIRRKDMPQIYDDETPQFLTYLRENGITSEFEEDYPVSKITPTQMEISVKRMKNILVRLQNDYYRDDNGEV